VVNGGSVEENYDDPASQKKVIQWKQVLPQIGRKLVLNLKLFYPPSCDEINIDSYI